MASLRGTKPPSPTKAAVDAKLTSAAARKLETLRAKVEAISRERVLEAAAAKRAAADEATREAAAIALAAKEAGCSERLLGAEARRNAAAEAARSKADAARARVASVAEAAESLLYAKQRRAAELKQQADELTRLRAAATSTARVAVAKSAREADDTFKQLEKTHVLVYKQDGAAQRREMGALDKVVRAASLGSAAVATARRRKLEGEAAALEGKADAFEQKLIHAEANREYQLHEIAEKAAETGVKVARARENAAAMETVNAVDGDLATVKAALASDRHATAVQTKRDTAAAMNARVGTAQKAKTDADADAAAAAKAKLDAKLAKAEINRAAQVKYMPPLPAAAAPKAAVEPVAAAADEPVAPAPAAANADLVAVGCLVVGALAVLAGLYLRA